jgi:hypothetical protein
MARRDIFRAALSARTNVLLAEGSEARTDSRLLYDAPASCVAAASELRQMRPSVALQSFSKKSLQALDIFSGSRARLDSIRLRPNPQSESGFTSLGLFAVFINVIQALLSLTH